MRLTVMAIHGTKPLAFFCYRRADLSIVTKYRDQCGKQCKPSSRRINVNWRRKTVPLHQGSKVLYSRNVTVQEQLAIQVSILFTTATETG